VTENKGKVASDSGQPQKAQDNVFHFWRRTETT
jgi:hypothetical protein